MKRKTHIYYLNALYYIYSKNCVTAFRESFSGSLTKVLREARQKAKSLKCDDWQIESMFPKLSMKATIEEVHWYNERKKK